MLHTCYSVLHQAKRDSFSFQLLPVSTIHLLFLAKVRNKDNGKKDMIITHTNFPSGLFKFVSLKSVVLSADRKTKGVGNLIKGID